MKSTKPKSTFEREMQHLKFRKAFQKSYQEFLLSELVISLMEHDHKSVRSLAEELHLSPTVIQKIRSGKQLDLKMSNFLSLFHSFGYTVVLEKGKERIALSA